MQLSVAAAVFLAAVGCDSSSSSTMSSPPSSPTKSIDTAGNPLLDDRDIALPLSMRPGSVYDDYGVEIKAIMLTANDHMLDLRFKVLDAQKAAPLFGRDRKPILIDQVSGARLIVPTPPKVGPLRQTSYEPREGRIHFILFANPNHLVKRGNRVTVVIDEFRAENLIVE